MGSAILKSSVNISFILLFAIHYLPLHYMFNNNYRNYSIETLIMSYFLYTLYTLPKIISRILPFIFFISIFFSLIKIEEKNELQIFWLNGIQKIDFVKFITKFSLRTILLQTHL